MTVQMRERGRFAIVKPIYDTGRKAAPLQRRASRKSKHLHQDAMNVRTPIGRQWKNWAKVSVNVWRDQVRRAFFFDREVFLGSPIRMRGEGGGRFEFQGPVLLRGKIDHKIGGF